MLNNIISKLGFINVKELYREDKFLYIATEIVEEALEHLS